MHRLIVPLIAFALLATGCPPLNNGSTFSVAVSGDSLVPAGKDTTLTASPNGGRAPFTYRWTQIDGEAELELADDMTATVRIVAPEVQDEYMLRVLVQDAGGRTGTAFFELKVGPEDIVPGEFAVAIQGPSGAQFGSNVLLSSFTDRENAEFLWEVIEGQANVNDPAAAETTVEPTQLGDLVIRLTATDPETSEVVTDEISIGVSPLVDIDGPPLAFAGEPALISVTVEPDEEGVELGWSIIQGSGELSDESSAETMLTTELGETLLIELVVTVMRSEGEPITVTRELEIISVESLLPRVKIDTTFGSFTFELQAEAAPLTVANFLAYVDYGWYEGVLIHRVQKQQIMPDELEPFVIQGGGYIRDNEGDLKLKELVRPPIPNESDNGLTNDEIYSVAMALLTGNPNSATTQWFVNMNNNGFLDDRDDTEEAVGFTVFAHVVEGTDVLDAMMEVEVTDNPTVPIEPLESLPAEDIVITGMERVPAANGDNDEDGSEDGEMADEGTP